MAKSRIPCATPDCRSEILVVERNRATADRRAAWLQSQGAICDDCRDQQRRAESEQAAQQASADGLPTLTGSPRQMQWAEALRRQWLDQADRWLAGDPKERNPYRHGYAPELAGDDPRYLTALEQIRQECRASWWIDHRDQHPGRILDRVAGKLDPGTTLAVLHQHQEMVAEAQAEATLRPAGDVVTETVTEVRALDGAIEAVMPERREDFRAIVKTEQRLRWTGKCWRREIPTTAGTPIDRAVELACRLLAEGFPVRIHDEEIRARVMAEKYQPEITRWVRVREGGEHPGWFDLRWGREDNYYRAARRITGSRYDPPTVVVPPEQFDEVEEFAEMHGFHITKAARIVMDRAAEIRAGATLVESHATRRTGGHADTAPPVLDPNAVSEDIPDELCDTEN